MERRDRYEKNLTGIWQAEYTDVRDFENTYYKYAVTGKNGTFLKSDPYAFSSQTLNETASVIKSLDGIKFVIRNGCLHV